MLIDIPTGNLPYVVVEELPETGEENTIYGVPQDDFFNIDYRYVNGGWEEVDLGNTVFGFQFADYQESVKQTITEMGTKITELEEAVFGVETTFQMNVSSSVRKLLDLVDGDGNVIVPGALQTERWNFDKVTCQVTVPKGTYYLRSTDNYAIGVLGEILPLVVDGTAVVNLGEVKVILIGGAK